MRAIKDIELLFPIFVFPSKIFCSPVSFFIDDSNGTLFEIFIFCPKIPLWFLDKIVEYFEWKTRENVVVLDFLAVDNFDFTRKIVKKIWVKNSWKCWGFVIIEFLDKNLTFRIVWKLIILAFEIPKIRRVVKLLKSLLTYFLPNTFTWHNLALAIECWKKRTYLLNEACDNA